MKKLLLILCLTIISLVGYSQNETIKENKLITEPIFLESTETVINIDRRLLDIEYELWQLKKPKYCDTKNRINQRSTDTFWVTTPTENYICGGMLILTWVGINLLEPIITKKERDILATSCILLNIGTFATLTTIRTKRDKRCLMWYFDE